tara:strand:+ start:11201 stop:12358 length:1158 start_codon:yes stop_codon:yes gene_type:complete
MKFLLNFGVVAVVFLSAPFSEVSANIIDSRSSCISVYQPSKVLPNGRRVWYLHQPEAIGDGFEPKYVPKGKVVELKEPEVSNQCQTTECYLFSVINFINVFNKNQVGGKAPVVSEPFLVAHKFLEHIKETLRLGPDSPELIHDLEGGFPYEAFHLTRKVGLVPKEAWTPKVPFEHWDTNKIYRALRHKVPEQHQILTKLAEKTGSWESQEVKEAQAKAFAELQAVILEFTGPLPQGFVFKGQNYTPESFERQYGIPRLVSFYIHNSGEYAVPENHSMVLRQAFTQQGGRYRVYDGVGESMITTIRDYIDQKLPVIIDLKWHNDGHSMLVVGYEFDEVTNTIVRFKVMNSWGNTFGNGGFAWYTPEDVIKNTTGTYRISMPGTHFR